MPTSGLAALLLIAMLGAQAPREGPRPTLRVVLSPALDQPTFIARCPNYKGRVVPITELQGDVRIRLNGVEYRRLGVFGKYLGGIPDVGFTWEDRFTVDGFLPVAVKSVGFSHTLGRARFASHLSRGEHTLEYSCGGPWSEPLEFEWNPEPYLLD